jgi:hypothetical protein
MFGNALRELIGYFTLKLAKRELIESRTLKCYCKNELKSNVEQCTNHQSNLDQYGLFTFF